MLTTSARTPDGGDAAAESTPARHASDGRADSGSHIPYQNWTPTAPVNHPPNASMQWCAEPVQDRLPHDTGSDDQ